MSPIRKFVAEYVRKHLADLRVVSTAAELGEAPSSAHPTIATHSGSFHCDEALACGFLRHVTTYATAPVIRTRDPKEIDASTIVVDVGAIYDETKLRFDHHQASFHGTMTTPKKTYHTRLSSAGLVYKHYGREIIAAFVKAALASTETRDALLTMTNWEATRTEMSAAELDVLVDVMYEHFVEQVDGIDNGVEAFGLKRKNPRTEEGEEDAVELVKNYTQSTHLSARVGRLQSWWNESENGNAVAENSAFVEAVHMTTSEFFALLSYYAFSWLPARSFVEHAFAKAKTIHPSGHIVVFEGKSCPWKDHLLEIEEEQGCVGQVLYVLFSDGKGWRVQAVPKTSTSFENRKPLPYRGLRDDDLSKASGIDGGVFVHVSGFIGGMKTYEAALQLAIQALTVE